MNRLRRFQGLTQYFFRALQLIWSAAPRQTILWLVLLIVQGLLPAATVYLTRELVNSLVAAIEGGGAWESVRPAILLAVAMGIVLALTELLRGVGNWVRTSLSEQVRDSVSDLIQSRSLAVDLAFYDLPEYYDHLYRAGQEASYRPVALLENLGALLQNGITLVAMMLVLVPYGIWLPIILFAGTLPALYFVLRSARRRHEHRRRTTTDERLSWYYNWLLTTREAAAEVRLFGLGPRFRDRYRELRRRLRTAQLMLVRQEALAELAAGFFGLLTIGGTMIWMVWRLLQGVLTLGDLALIYQAFAQGQNLMRTLLQSVGQLYGNSLFLSDLFEFLGLEPTVRDPDSPLELAPATGNDAESIAVRFRDVVFKYPGSERLALNHFNLDIPAGKTVALVGTNGAGKSTFIKLLCRFYDPVGGVVELFGRDVRMVRQEDLHRTLSVLFQQPQQYNATVAENIALGNQGRASREELELAALYSGADEVIGRLPDGYDTLLGIWFVNGTDLSVGEWRRIGLARTLLRPAPIFILDEPTSAMDPWAEMEWVDRLREFAAGRTVILITHRFTTALHADVIHVMEDGAIVESGTHDELIDRDGRYAQSWAEQLRSRTESSS